MKNKFYEKLLELKYDCDLCQEVDCTEEENKFYLDVVNQKKELPLGVYRRTSSDGSWSNTFYKVIPLDIPRERILDYCALKQMKHINTIKTCVVFFTVLTVISLILGLIGGLILLSSLV